MKSLKNLEAPCTEFRATSSAKGGVRIDRDGGDYSAGLIENFAVITRGEALGHNAWIDAEFLESVAKAGNKTKSGLKMRFTHPSMSNDAMGKFLARAKNFTVDGDVVRADMHISESAHGTPSGNLAEYVMDLADSDPDMFGASIVFRNDDKAAERFWKDNEKKSPDPDNKKNYPHVRLAALRAVDIVDSPAANKNGFFSTSALSVGEELEQAIEYTLGLTEDEPNENPFGVDLTRISGAVRRFFNNRGLEVAEKSKETTEMAADNKDEKDTKTGAGSVDLSAEKDKAVAEERQRVQGIKKLGRDNGIAQDVIDDAIEKNLGESEAAKVFLASIKDSRATPSEVSVTKDVTEKRSEFFANVQTGILLQRGVVPIDAKAREAGQQFVGVGFKDIARMAISMERKGDPVSMSEDKLFSTAITTQSFPELLSNAYTKSLMAAYQLYPGTFRTWAARRSVRDFKEYSDIKLSNFASPMPEVSPGGELSHAALSETKETYSAKTRGFMTTLTRQMFINDDLGGLLRIPEEMGVAAAMSIEDIGYNLLISASGVGPTMNEDSKALFATDHPSGANYTTGAGTVLSDTSLTSLKTLFRKMKGVGAKQFLNLMPRWMLVPPELEDTAKRLINSTTIMVAKGGTAGSVDTEYLPTNNIHFNSVEVVTEPRLSAGTNGTTAWYLICNPAQAQSLVLVLLNGRELPTVETVTMPGNVLGLGWRVYHDVGVAAIDFRGIARAKGA